MSGYYPDGCNQATFDRHWANQLDDERDVDDVDDDYLIELAREERARTDGAEARESD